MAKSNIEWTDFTWNPWHGCKKVSEGCYGQDPTQVVRASDKTFYAPLKLKEPQRVFTCSWSDFFIEEADAWRDEAFAIMALTPHITYQVLTKRPDRMKRWFTNAPTPPVGTLNYKFYRQWHVWAAMSNSSNPELADAAQYIWDWDIENYGIYGQWPLPNVWLGVSVEDQKTAYERIPLLIETPHKEENNDAPRN